VLVIDNSHLVLVWTKKGGLYFIFKDGDEKKLVPSKVLRNAPREVELLAKGNICKRWINEGQRWREASLLSAPCSTLNMMCVLFLKTFPVKGSSVAQYP